MWREIKAILAVQLGIQMMRLTSLIVACLLAVIPPSVPAAAQVPVGPSVNPTTVVSEVRAIIADRYVLPERRGALDAVLADGLASGRYDVSDPAELGERINADLARVGQDKHLNIRYDPLQASLITDSADEEADLSAYEQVVRERNHGIRQLRVLPGNVRLMTYDGFNSIGDDSMDAGETAMRFLAGGDAVIIDLRSNGGGSALAVQYLISHFLPADTPLVTFHSDGETQAFSTLSQVPAGRLSGKPLYVLTSGGTASAAEEFTGHVLGYGIGEVVGGTTAGAGYISNAVSIAGQYRFSVSVGRAVLASTGKDWEAVGHTPTIATTLEDALDTAHAHALRSLAAATTGDDQAKLETLAQGVEARTTRPVPDLPLTAYAGTYGERVIRVEQDHLVLQRGSRFPVRLIAMGGHRFTLDTDPASQIEFEISGQSVGAMTAGAVGESSQARYPRSGQ